MSYTVRRPFGSDSSLDGEGMVVSRHRTLAGARKALEGQQKGARKQGGYSQDYIWCETLAGRVLEVYGYDA